MTGGPTNPEGSAPWARARIERLLDPAPLPGKGWLFVASLRELGPHATAAEKVKIFLRTTVPTHDDALRFLEPLDDALAEAIAAYGPRITGNQLHDLHPVILALALVAAHGRTGRTPAPAWDAFLARDFSLYERFDFELTRAALWAVPPARRRGIVLEALLRRERLALFVIDTVEGDPEVFRAALGLVAGLDQDVEHGTPAAQGLARGGSAIVPLLLEALARPRLERFEEPTLLNALAWIGDPSAAEALVAATGRSSAAVAAAAVRALAALGASARPALEAGAKARKKAVREACAWLLVLLDDPAASDLRAARTAHGPFLDAIDRWAGRRADREVPGLRDLEADPLLPWALVWVLATRPLHPHHLGAVVTALAKMGDRTEAPLALLRARPEAIRAHGMPWPLR